jgi:hypothetical protein
MNNDLYHDIISDDRVVLYHAEGSPSPSPPLPPISNDSYIEDMIYCPFHCRLVNPRIYLQNPWSVQTNSKPDINLDNHGIARFDIVAILPIDNALEIPVAAEILSFLIPSTLPKPVFRAYAHACTTLVLPSTRSDSIDYLITCHLARVEIYMYFINLPKLPEKQLFLVPLPIPLLLLLLTLHYFQLHDPTASLPPKRLPLSLHYSLLVWTFQ